MKKPDLLKSGKVGKYTIDSNAYHILVRSIHGGDIFCTRGAGWLSENIRVFSARYSSDREVYYNHAGILPENKSGCSIEALKRTETSNIFNRYEGRYILIARYTHMNKYRLKLGINAIIPHIDKPYPWPRLLFHAINIAQVFHWDNLVCSELVGKFLFNIGARHHHYFGTTPDHLADEIHNELNEERTGPKYDIQFEGQLPIQFYMFCPSCLTLHLMGIGWQCPTCQRKIYLPEPHLFADKITIDNFLMNNVLTPAHQYNQMKGIWAKEEKIEIKQKVKFQMMRNGITLPKDID